MDAPDVLAIHDLLPRYGHVVIERRTVVPRRARA
jgi:hypothetical protein